MRDNSERHFLCREIFCWFRMGSTPIPFYYRIKTIKQEL
jgi:hypothetical protein